VARGIIAVGQIAIGGIAVGQVAVGVIALGQVGAGLLFAVAQLAWGWAAVGQLGAGAGLTIGQFAAGPDAMGPIVWGGRLSWLVLSALWTGTAIVLAARARAQRGPFRRLLEMRGVTIQDARPGLVVVAGRVVAGRTVEGPVSKRVCVGYDVRRLVLDRAPRCERHCEDFLIEDGTGRARVVASDTVLLLDPRLRVAHSVDRVLAEAGVAASSTRPVRMSRETQSVETSLERVLLPGDPVVVAGLATRTLDGGASPRERKESLHLVLHGGAAGPVLVTNRNLPELKAELDLGLWMAVAFALGHILIWL
jgi:hypothetical protein